jgi:hypothetical protein
VIIHTRSGSVYRICPAASTWERLTGTTTGLRTGSGFYQRYVLPGPGRPLVLVCPPLVAGAAARIITTSQVVSIEEEKEEHGKPGAGPACRQAD